MNDLIGTLSFLCVFHIIGGVALGGTLRNWLRNGFSCREVFLIVWGVMFGGIPLLMGVALFTQHGAIHLVIVEIGVLVAAIAIAALVPDWFLEAYSAPKVMSIAVGGLFVLVGAVISMLTFKSEPLMALLFFGVFSGIGGLVFISSLFALLKE